MPLPETTWLQRQTLAIFLRYGLLALTLIKIMCDGLRVLIQPLFHIYCLWSAASPIHTKGIERTFLN